MLEEYTSFDVHSHPGNELILMRYPPGFHNWDVVLALLLRRLRRSLISTIRTSRGTLSTKA